MTVYRRTAAALLALVFLNGILSFRNWWRTPGILPDARLAPGFVARYERERPAKPA